MLDWVYESFEILIGDVLSKLPDSPFLYMVNTLDGDYDSVLGIANYFLDLSTAIVLGETWLTAVAGYLVLYVILKVVKLV